MPLAGSMHCAARNKEHAVLQPLLTAWPSAILQLHAMDRTPGPCSQGLALRVPSAGIAQPLRLPTCMLADPMGSRPIRNPASCASFRLQAHTMHHVYM